jgi:hypothetical protein
VVQLLSELLWPTEIPVRQSSVTLSGRVPLPTS